MGHVLQQDGHITVSQSGAVQLPEADSQPVCFRPSGFLRRQIFGITVKAELRLRSGLPVRLQSFIIYIPGLFRSHKFREDSVTKLQYRVHGTEIVI